jgi:hypothetical protein
MFKFSQNRKVNKHLVTAIKFIKAFRGAGMRWSPFLGYKSYTFKIVLFYTTHHCRKYQLVPLSHTNYNITQPIPSPDSYRDRRNPPLWRKYEA